MRRTIMMGAALLIGLAACEEGEIAENDAAGERIVSGEVLEGTISDEMIALETLRSQAPAIEVVPESAASGAPATPPAAAQDSEAVPQQETDTVASPEAAESEAAPQAAAAE